MKKNVSTVALTVALIILSLSLYLFQLTHFHAPRDTAFYFVQDMAFLPLQVAMVTIVLGSVLSMREKRERIKKMNILVGAFFSEIGTELIRQLAGFAARPGELQALLNITADWADKDYHRAALSVKSRDLAVCCPAAGLQNIRALLSGKRFILFMMLENPNLLEHETFTDMLWAVFHLTDELLARENIENLPGSDIKHLENDVKRVFGTVLVQWVSYMSHLKSDYPYLFSLELRRNPFCQNGGVIIR